MGSVWQWEDGTLETILSGDDVSPVGLPDLDGSKPPALKKCRGRLTAMAGAQVDRETLPGGGIRLTAGNCTFSFSRPKPKCLWVVIEGLDTGQFGLTTLDEIAAALNREGDLELFVDAREAVGAAVSVSDEWTRFFVSHRSRLRRVHVLVGSEAVYLTIAIAQHLSRTGDLIQIYSDADMFQSRLDRPA